MQQSKSCRIAWFTSQVPSTPQPFRISPIGFAKAVPIRIRSSAEDRAHAKHGRALPMNLNLVIEDRACSVLNWNCNPEWGNGDNLPQDRIHFVAGVIDRSRKVRQHVEAAPHQLENA
jgi:hypothetical protein